MKFMKMWAFSFIIVACTMCRATGSLNLLSMNVYMIPKPVKFSMQGTRTKAIAEQLKNSNYEVVFFQEAFIESFRTTLQEVLGERFKHSYYMAGNSKWTQILGSGLFVMSRYPIKILDQHVFDDCKGFDCFAAKGAFIVELTLPDQKKIQIATTHLQAGYQNGGVRLKQLSQIKSALNSYKTPGVAQLLVGDLNIDFSDPEFITGQVLLGMKYSSLSGNIKTTNARTNECYSTPERKLWIDHVWFDREFDQSPLELQVKDFSFSFENKSCPSSDHHGVQVSVFNDRKAVSKIKY